MSIRKTVYLLISVAVFNSCLFFNRMTSPEILDKEEHIWTIGAAIDPLELAGEGEINESPIFGVQPVIGYRSGIGKNKELGVAIYGPFWPGMVLDLKHKLYVSDNFYLSGDLAAFGGWIRPIGLQYDFLFGNRELYGCLGLSYDFFLEWSEYPFWNIGIGSDLIGNSPFGFQIAYSGSFPSYYYDRGVGDIVKEDPVGFLSIGLKIDLLEIKKKHR